MMAKEESFTEQLARVCSMASGDPTWDLSPKDIAALKAVLEHMAKLSKQREESFNPWGDD